MRLALFLPLAALLACQATAPPPPPPPGPPEPPSACEAACEGLRRASCEEGGPNCLVACERSALLLSWPLACWSEAQTREDVRACGGARCR